MLTHIHPHLHLHLHLYLHRHHHHHSHSHLAAFASPAILLPSHLRPRLSTRLSPALPASTPPHPHRRRCRPYHPVPTLSTAAAAATAAAADPDFPDRPHPSPDDDPFHDQLPPFVPASTSTAFSSGVARSSLHALALYYRQLCVATPFIARRLALAIVAIVVSKLVGLAVPFLFKNVVDLLLASATTPAAAPRARAAASTTRAIAVAILLHGLAKILAAVAHELRNSVFAKAGQRIGRAITAASFAHIHSLEAAFHTTSQTGSVTRVIDRGTRSVLTIFRGVLFSFGPSLLELALVCAVLLRRFSPLYVAVTLLTFVAFIAWTLVINDELGSVRAQMNAVENEASGKLTDSLLNVEAVKSFDNADFELRRYDESLANYEATAIRNEWLFARLNIGQGTIYTIGLTCNLLLAANGVMAGTLSVGSVVLLASMLQQLWIPLNFLGWQYREVKQSLIDLQNLFELLSRESRIQDAPDATPLTVSGGEIVFENVSFAYPEPDDSLAFARKQSVRPLYVNGEVDTAAKRELALQNLSFKVPAGKSVALVGSSGSGKSTATRLLYRLYDLSGGRILIDGQDISKATLSSLRQAVSIVPQDTILFNDTIAYNVRYGRPSATDEEVIAAAKAASIHDVIMRTVDGYQTLVGERGVRLSGGERQRLSVARAFLKGSKIILEDESTSALDTLTEMEVSKALAKLGVDRTRIIVAHRLSTVMNVDHMVVLRFGRKVEEGTFDDLVRRPNGVFRGMWERQQKKGEAEDGESTADGTDDVGAIGVRGRDEMEVA